MNKKSATFTKGKSKFLQNHWGEGEGWRVTFCGKFRSLFSKLMFAHVEVAMEWWKRKTKNSHQKLNGQVPSSIAKHIRTYDLRK